MVSIRTSLGLTAAVLAMATMSACSKKAEEPAATAPAETAATAPAAAPAAAEKVAVDNVDTVAGVKFAIQGRKSGSVPGYSYSTANKNSGITWTNEKLFQYLETPQRIIPGTKMTYTGLKDPQKRADVIAYLDKQI